MDKKPSEYIEEFLKFIREAPEEYDAAVENQSIADAETQDILHWREFNYNHELGLDSIMKLDTAEAVVRRKRRKAKNTAQLMGPVNKWAQENISAKNPLEQLLGEVRRTEREMEKRRYADKTDIIKRIFGESIEAKIFEKKMEEKGQ